MNAELDIKEALCELPIKTRDGQFVAQYSTKGLCGLSFPSHDSSGTRAPNGHPIPAEIQGWHRETATALEIALAGRPIIQFPPLDLSAGTDFQQRVWRVLKNIACGRTLSYGQVADEIGDCKAVRAVGRACGANPIPVLIPCHRVLASKQKIGGFSGGLNWKRKLLAREGVLLLE
jgi:O-6-methylguanine DNA methyltransferase